MKTILKIILILTALIAISCDNLYNELAVEIGEYDYYLVTANQNVTSFVSTFLISSEGSISPKFKSSTFGATFDYYPAAHPNGNYLYVPDRSNDRLRIYNVCNDGTLIFSTDVATGDLPISVVVHPTGKYLYVSNMTVATGSISMFKINDNGSLLSLGTISIATGFRPLKMYIHPSGNYLYTAMLNPGTNYVDFSSYSINSNGSLSSLESDINLASIPSHYTTDVLVHPGGQYLYVSASNGNIYKCNINTNGTIGTKTYVTAAGSSAVYFAVHPSGNYLFTGSILFVRSYLINISDGTLTYLNGDIATLGHKAIIAHPNGKYLYTVNTGSANGSYQRFNIDSSGSITLIDDIDYSTSGYIYNPSGMALIRRKKL